MSMISEQIKEIRWLKDMIVAHIPSKSWIKNTNDILDRTIDTIETLSAKVHANNMHGGWIPVEERLPDKIYSYLVTRGNEEYCYRQIDHYNGNGEWTDDTVKNKYKVIAWMPLPEPYRQEHRHGKCDMNCEACQLEDTDECTGV